MRRAPTGTLPIGAIRPSVSGTPTGYGIQGSVVARISSAMALASSASARE